MTLAALVVSWSTRSSSSTSPPRTSPEIAQYRDLWRFTFRQALEADEIDDAHARSEFRLGVLLGALSQIRLVGDTSAAQPMTSVVIETIRSWVAN